MKIATMVRGYLPVPRPEDMVYAPIDLSIEISQCLTEKGHQVDFYAPEGSEIEGVPVKSLGVRSIVHNQKEWLKFLNNIELQVNYMPSLWDQYMALEMFQRADRGEYDILHFHHPQVALPFAVLFPNVPVVYTLHDPLYPWYYEVFKMYRTPNQHFVSISDSQRKHRLDLNYAATVYNGIDVDSFPFSSEHDDYLLFAGRLVPEKGLKEAVQIALRTGQKLIIAGILFPDNRPYFNKWVKPYLNDQIQYVGLVERRKLHQYYQRAKALLMPIQWDEPFGLTMIEAMACGLPVVALNRGSVPEVLADGKTGFIVNSVEEMIAALDKVDGLDRAACRQHVEDNFSIQKMADGYEATYQKILRQK